MKARLLMSRLSFRFTAWLVIVTHVFWGHLVLAQTLPHDELAAGYVSNVSGEVYLHRPHQPAIGEPLKFKGTVGYGDTVRTSTGSVLGMLLGDKTLVVMEEQSALHISKDSNARRVVELAEAPSATATTTAISKRGTREMGRSAGCIA